MTAYTRNFYFDLFLEQNLTPVYEPSLVNKITKDTYRVKSSGFPPTSNSCYMVRDLPDYLDLKVKKELADLKTVSIPQYTGGLMDLTPYENAEQYLRSRLSASQLKKLRSKYRSLSRDYPLTHSFYFGGIDRSTYDALFQAFFKLLQARFVEKKMFNTNLLKWDTLHQKIYPLLLAKKAALSVVYAAGKPILINLNLVHEDILFSYMQTYDLSFSKYNLGDISKLKHLEWAYENNIRIIDLAMGETAYKRKWCNLIYPFHYQLIYPKRSLAASFWAQKNILSLKMKWWLRKKGLLGGSIQYHKLLYQLREDTFKSLQWDPGTKDHT